MPVISCPGQEIENVTGLQCAGSDPGLKPHCVPRDEDGQLGLVCTLWIWLGTDICPAYSETHQQIVYGKCKGNKSECPSDKQYHRSFEAYKYKGCIPDMTKSSGSVVGLEVQKSQETPDGTSVKTTTERSATSTETTPESTLSTVRKCDEDSSKLSTCAVPIAICVVMAVIVCIFCIIIVWDCYTGKHIQQVIRSCLENGSHDNKKTNGSPESQERSATERNSFLGRESEGVKVWRWSQERMR